MANRTALFSRRQKGGFFVVDDLPEHGGDIWFVDSGNTAASDSAGYGKDPDSPFATLDYAIGKCTASSGDVIYLMPGHSETLASAGAVTMDVNGVKVVGLGHGDVRPTFTFATAAAASIVVSACDCEIHNCIFKCNIANQAHMIDLQGDDFLAKDCWFLEGSATGEAFIVADTSDGDSNYTTIKDCLFYSSSAGNMDEAIQIGKDHVGWRIENCDIYGDFDEAGIEVPAGGDASSLLQIYNNRITNLQADDHAIQISGTGVTGWAVGNKLQTNAQATAFDSSALSCHDNTWVDTDGNNDEEAVPANTQHATATQVTDLVADAITNAKIGDNALAYENYDQDAPVFKTISKASLALDGGSIEDVFTVAGGPVQLIGLLMFITEAVSNNSCTAQWQLDPTTGASDNPLCGTLDIDSAAIGDCLYITGVHDGAMVNAANGTECGQMCSTSVMLTPGGVDLDLQNSDPSSGIATVYLIYRPMAQGVTVTAA